jgi:hypothetical protein
MNIPADTLPLIVADSQQHTRAAAAGAVSAGTSSVSLAADRSVRSSHSTDAEGSVVSRTASSDHQQQLQLQQAPVQLDIPVYSNSLTLTLLLHRKGVVMARLVARVHGILPLLVRQHRSTLYFHK